MQHLARWLTITVLLALQGCSSLPSTNQPAATATIPAASPLMDHFIAWIPRDRAQTAAVAEAMAHISLVNAQEKTARQLCSGQWMVNGDTVERIGPLPATAPAAAGGYPAWYYRISHLSGLQGCKHSNREELYLALQKNLPAWMNIKTARITRLSLLQ